MLIVPSLVTVRLHGRYAATHGKICLLYITRNWLQNYSGYDVTRFEREIQSIRIIQNRTGHVSECKSKNERYSSAFKSKVYLHLTESSFEHEGLSQGMVKMLHVE